MNKINPKTKFDILSISTILFGLVVTLLYLNSFFFIDYFSPPRPITYVGSFVYFVSIIFIGVLLRAKIISSFFILRYFSLAYIIEFIIILLIIPKSEFIPFFYVNLSIGAIFFIATFDKNIFKQLIKNNSK